ncbi:hypothetical protein BDR04DRAFT_1105652 [Suillus decipiens]|nr:hypothetical protein BDR04DRAFT_1105652 [Suillus decipiens]
MPRRSPNTLTTLTKKRQNIYFSLLIDTYIKDFTQRECLLTALKWILISILWFLHIYLLARA